MIGRYYLHCDEVFPNAISGIVISYESYRATEQKNYMHSRGTSPRKIVTKRNCVDKILSDPMAMANDWRARSEAWFMGRLRETSVSYIRMYMHTRMQSSPSDRRNSRGKALAERDSVVASLPKQNSPRNIAAIRCILLRRIDRRTDKSIDRDRSHAIRRFDLTDRNVRSHRCVTRRRWISSLRVLRAYFSLDALFRASSRLVYTSIFDPFELLLLLSLFYPSLPRIRERIRYFHLFVPHAFLFFFFLSFPFLVCITCRHKPERLH